MSSRNLLLFCVTMVTILLDRSAVNGNVSCYECADANACKSPLASFSIRQNCVNCGLTMTNGVLTRKFCGQTSGDHLCTAGSNSTTGVDTTCCTTNLCNIPHTTPTFRCYTCSGTTCPDHFTAASIQTDKCVVCGKTVVNNKLTEATCGTTADACKDGTPAGTTCCHTNLCNFVVPSVPVVTSVPVVPSAPVVASTSAVPSTPVAQTIKCYTCSGSGTSCPDGITTAVAQSDKCVVCSKRVNNNKIVEANCGTTVDVCINGTPGTSCCSTDLCNSGVSHSIGKSVVVGSLVMTISAFYY